MTHRNYDVFEIAPEPAVWFENKTVQFATGVEGHIESVAVPLEPAVAPIIFRRLPEPEIAAHSLLEPLTGVYRIANMLFRIEFRRNATGQVDALLSHEPTGTYLAERDAAPR